MTSNILLKRLINLALEEDLLHGDITSELTIPASKQAVGKIVAQDTFLFCGGFVISEIIKESGINLFINNLVNDGIIVTKGSILAELDGSARSILSIERTILNFLQRLSSISTHVHNLASQSHNIRLIDTRKTTPGWRYLEKYAVRLGGGYNHRFCLGDMILIKDNHIDANGGIANTFKNLKDQNRSQYIPVEVEVQSINQLREVLPYSPDVVMLDNFSDELIKEALDIIKSINSKVCIEVSGGITVDRLPRLAALGIEVVSMGSLTFPEKKVDINLSLEWGPSVK